MASICMDTPWESWTVRDRISEKQNIDSQKNKSKILSAKCTLKWNMVRVTGNITWIRYQQANMKVLPANKNVPRIRWLAASTCSSLRWWRIGFQRCKISPLYRLMIIVPPTESKTPAILSNPAMLLMCSASILMQEQYAQASICFRSEFIYLLFVANYAVICIWSLNYNEKIEIYTNMGDHVCDAKLEKLYLRMKERMKVVRGIMFRNMMA